MATNNLATAFPNSFAQATPRQQFMGLLADSLKWPLSPKRTQQMQVAAEFFGIPALQRTADEISYGGALGTGKGMTWQPKSDTVESALMLAPNAFIAKRLAGRAATALAPTANAMARVAIEKRLVDIGGIQPATVWQGSPHRFAPTAKNPLGEFDASKIGTGEGAQAYGYGHYLADAPEVATEYMNKLSGNVNARGAGYYPKINGQVVRDDFPDLDVIRKVAHETLPKPSGIMGRGGRDSISSDDAIKALVEKNNKILNDPIYFQSAKVQAKEENKLLLKYIGKNIETSTPSLYKVDLPDEHIAKMLDWDKPLSQQPANVQAAINGPSGRTGEEIYNQFKIAAKFGFKSKPGDEVERLRLMGIPGIRYLDGGSRAGGAGTSNYVVFPGGEDFLKILQRNGQTAAK